MSRNRGRRYELLLARYLRAWWPHAEAPPPSRPGTDVLGTPGIVWENKTAREFSPLEFCRQAKRHAGPGDIPVTVYWPPSVGEASAARTLAIVPLHTMIRLLTAAGYGTAPEEVTSVNDPATEAGQVAASQDRDAEASQEEVYEADGGDTMHDGSHY